MVATGPPRPVAVNPPRNLSGFDVIGIGEVMVLLQADEGTQLEHANTVRMLVAGAELNACAAVTALGGSAAVLTRLGRDPFAAHIQRRARELGVGMIAQVDATRPTGIFFKDLTVDDERRVHYYRSGSAASAMNESDLDTISALRPRALLASGLTAALGDGAAALLLAAAASAERDAIPLVVDANLRPAIGNLDRSIRTIRALLPSAALLVLGTDEGDAIFDTSDPQTIMTRARSAGCREVTVKAGAGGAYWMDVHGIAHHVPTAATHVTDTVGAGDAFTGAYLWARQNGYARKDATLIGSRIAARIVAVPGDTEGLPTIHERSSIVADLTPGHAGWS
jgi:2-dehydro-3-deoxygluconokinase